MQKLDKPSFFEMITVFRTFSPGVFFANPSLSSSICLPREQYEPDLPDDLKDLLEQEWLDKTR